MKRLITPLLLPPIIALAFNLVTFPDVIAVAEPIPSIPAINQWESNMVRFGRLHCDTMAKLRASGTAEERLNSTYYDAERVYLQIEKHTTDVSWRECAAVARTFYRDEHVLPKK